MGTNVHKIIELENRLDKVFFVYLSKIKQEDHEQDE